MRRFGVLTSGGDAPGMNACIRAVARDAVRHNVEILGIRFGYRGLLANDMAPLGPRSVANTIQLGGTILGTSRCPEMKTQEGLHKAAEIVRERGIEGLILLGGDGTFRGGTELAELTGVKVIGAPCTIDNDVYGTDYTIGFDTAVNTALESIDKIRDTAQSFERLFFVEVMGRTRGFIALEVGIAGGAEEVLVPETETNLELLCRELQTDLARGKKSMIIVVSEGDTPGGAMTIAERVGKELDVDYRVAILGHVQRGGSPTARDRVLGSKLGVAALDGILNGKEGCMAGEIAGKIAYTPMRDTWEKSRDLDHSLLPLVKILSA